MPSLIRDFLLFMQVAYNSYIEKAEKKCLFVCAVLSLF